MEISRIEIQDGRHVHVFDKLGNEIENIRKVVFTSELKKLPTIELTFILGRESQPDSSKS